MQEYKRLKPYNVGFITDKIVGLVTVDRPVTETNIVEASKVGLTILSRSTDPNKSLYRYNGCGHTEFLQPTHVRRNNFRCNTCARIYEILKADKSGSLLLFRTCGQYRKCLRNCGHIVETTFQCLSKDSEINCNLCFEEMLLKTATANGYRIISCLGGGRRVVGFSDCQHTKEVHQCQIQRGNIVCRDCSSERHYKDVESLGLEYLRPSEHSRYNYYKLPCGHEKILRQDHAEQGAYLCEHCGDNHYTRPSNIYLLKFTLDNFTWLKLGFARNVGIRVSNYGTPQNTKMEVLKIVPLDSGYSAMEFEKAIHRKYKQQRYSKSEMIKYHTSNGFTECYPLNYESVLLTELNKLGNNKND